MREELYHPMLAHFPIVLFLMILILKILVLTLALSDRSGDLSQKLNWFARILLVIAPLIYLVTLYLGDSALEIIKNDFCDLKSIYAHEEMAKQSLIFIILSLILEGVGQIEKIKIKMEKPLMTLTVLILIAGNFLILKTAHSGAMLVYDKGAAVLSSPQACN